MAAYELRQLLARFSTVCLSEYVPRRGKLQYQVVRVDPEASDLVDRLAKSEEERLAGLNSP
jgi:hypothetical protein